MLLTVVASVPRGALQVQATETWSPSGSLVVVVAVRLSLVFGELELKAGVVNDGAELTIVTAEIGRASWRAGGSIAVASVRRESKLDPLAEPERSMAAEVG